MLSKQITYLRKTAGLSQSQLAAELNVSPSTIGMYGQEHGLPALMHRLRICSTIRGGKPLPSPISRQSQPESQWHCSKEKALPVPHCSFNGIIRSGPVVKETACASFQPLPEPVSIPLS